MWRSEIHQVSGLFFQSKRNAIRASESRCKKKRESNAAKCGFEKTGVFIQIQSFSKIYPHAQVHLTESYRPSYIRQKGRSSGFWEKVKLFLENG